MHDADRASPHGEVTWPQSRDFGRLAKFTFKEIESPMSILRTLITVLSFSIMTISSLTAQDRKDATALASESKESLVGEWVAEKVLSSGREVPKEKFPFELQFTDTQLIYKFVGNIQGKDRVHDIRIDSSQSPPAIDITRTVRDKKVTVLAIFKHENDQLLLCFTRTSDGNPSETRPSNFESSEDTKNDLMILKRKLKVEK